MNDTCILHVFHCSQETPRGTLGANWMGGLNASAFCGEFPAHMPAKVGKQTLDLALSFYVLAGTTAALFHAERTGEGQLVDIPQVRCSFWSMQVGKSAREWAICQAEKGAKRQEPLTCH